MRAAVFDTHRGGQSRPEKQATDLQRSQERSAGNEHNSKQKTLLAVVEVLMTQLFKKKNNHPV